MEKLTLKNVGTKAAIILKSQSGKGQLAIKHNDELTISMVEYKDYERSIRAFSKYMIIEKTKEGKKSKPIGLEASKETESEANEEVKETESEASEEVKNEKPKRKAKKKATKRSRKKS